MKYLQVERLGAGFLDDCDIGAGPLVGPGQCIGSPVCPIDITPEQGHGKRVRQILMTPENLYKTTAIVERRVDGVRAEEGRRKEQI